MATKVMILMALEAESQGLFEGLPIHYTGMGKTRAAYHTTRLIQGHRPDWIVNLGTAGSFSLPQGSLVECTQFVQRDPFPLLAREKLSVPPVTKLPAVCCGTADFVEVSRPSGGTARPFDVMDMEAFAMAYVCREMNVKFSCVKFVSDSSDKNTLKDWRKNLRGSSEALLKAFLDIKKERGF